MLNKPLITITLLFLMSFGLHAKPLEFELTNGQGEQVTANSWPNQYLLIAIGYTYCPDICPTTLVDMSYAMKHLGDKSALLTPVFISIDPNRDTPEKLGKYTHYFHKKMEGLVGSAEQTAAVAKSLKASYGYKVDGRPAKAPLPEEYDVFHSSYIYFYGPDGNLIDVFGYGMRGEEMAKRILSLLTKSS